MPFSSQEILSIAVGAAFAAGLNVYATVAVLGLLAHAQVIHCRDPRGRGRSWRLLNRADDGARQGGSGEPYRDRDGPVL